MPADSEDILAWRNDPHTIDMSLSGSRVSETEHRQWFEGTLNNPDCVHVIGESRNDAATGSKIGVCRFNLITDAVWAVSVNLNPAERSKGYATGFLGESILFFTSFLGGESCTLRALIKVTNPKSVRIFEHNGFKLSHQDSGVLVMVKELVDESLGGSKSAPNWNS